MSKTWTVSPIFTLGSVSITLTLTLTSPMPSSSALGSDYALFLLLSVLISLAAWFLCPPMSKFSVSLLTVHCLSTNTLVYLAKPANTVRALRQIGKSLTDYSTNSIACAIIGSRLDYANAVLVGISASNIKKLQWIQNTLACIVTRQYGNASTSQCLPTLHWLPIKWRIDFKVATISYKLLSTGQPSYLASSISLHTL